MKKETLNKFYKKSRLDRVEALYLAEVISQEDYEQLKNDQLELSDEVADRMIENVVAK